MIAEISVFCCDKMRKCDIMKGEKGMTDREELQKIKVINVVQGKKALQWRLRL